VATAAATVSVGSGWFAEAASALRMALYFHAPSATAVASTAETRATDRRRGWSSGLLERLMVGDLRSGAAVK
jgi:hypothetical protein